VIPAALPGEPFPLGATPGPTGTNFAVVSAADGVLLCLFDADGTETQVPLRDRDGEVWHGFLPGVGAGQAYGYRATGPYDPHRGLRCNPAKLLLDPYARAIDGEVRFGPDVLGYAVDDHDMASGLDSAAHVPRSLVVDTAFAVSEGTRPHYSYADTVLYEIHVKGFTAAHPAVPEELRGTYAGLAHAAPLAHLVDLGVTAVELLPVHHSASEPFLRDRGLTNYWGYNTIGYFAPHAAYSSTGHRGTQVQEFRGMVKALHAAGIEVILDVVYNHTAEGNHLGPTLSFRGIDNASYYRLVDDEPACYMDYTGTGNSLNVRSPHTLQLIMDSLRYWVTEMHVDGFRFDLAATLAREFYEVDRLSTFFEVVQQDPVVSSTKLIAEPWDVGPGGYQVGNFPPLWTEWNGKFRDTVRDFWRGEPATLGEFASRITGSADLYQDDGRRPVASINFVTCHDGFTLADLVSYNDKHNLANGEGNRDGESHNRSWNCGVEGPTDDEDILALRARQRRNLLATVLLAQGVPMIAHGDEVGRTQRGNNNTYCQDNDLTWVDWQHTDDQMLAFTRALTSFRARHPVFRRRRFFTGRPVRQATGTPVPDLEWFTPDGRVMTDAEWDDDLGRAVTLFLNGEGIKERGPRGERVTDDSFLLCFNAHHDWLEFALPTAEYGNKWELAFDTGVFGGDDQPRVSEAGTKLWVRDRSFIVLQRVT
jgi:glycogen operon protein